MPRQLVDPRRIYTLLLEEGGWHTHDEICEALAVQSWQERVSISSSLYALRRKGYVERRHGVDGVSRHGVTLRCKPLEDLDGHAADLGDCRGDRAAAVCTVAGGAR
ncbi:MAG: hypothetical protein OHK0044_28780 [Burkholderiaceae bacterium]